MARPQSDAVLGLTATGGHNTFPAPMRTDAVGRGAECGWPRFSVRPRTHDCAPANSRVELPRQPPADWRWRVCKRSGRASPQLHRLVTSGFMRCR